MMGVSNFSVFTAFKAKDGVSPVLNTMVMKGNSASIRLQSGFIKAKAGAMALKTAIVSIGTAFAAVAAFAPLKAFADWEKGILSVNTLMSGEEINKYNLKLKELSKSTIRMGFSVEDTNKGLFDTVSALGASDKAFDVYTQSAKLAKAGCTDLSVAIDGMTSVINAYGKESTNATAVANAFFTAQKKGKTTVAELAANIGQVAPLSKAAGVSLEETMSVMAALTLGGMSTDKAATGLRATLSALVKPSKEAEQTLRQFGVPVGLTEIKAKGLSYTLQKLLELQKKSPNAIASAIPNVKALTGVLALDEEKMKAVHDTLEMIQDDLKNGTGLNEAFEAMGGSSAATMARVMGELQVALIDLGNLVAPYLMPLVKEFGNFVKLLSDLLPKIKPVFDAIYSVFDLLKNTYYFVKDNWISILLAMPAAIYGVNLAIDILRVKMALCKMEGGLMAIMMNTKVMTALAGMTSSIWKSVIALKAQALAFMTTPWGIAIMAITAVIGVFIYLYKHCEKVKNAFNAFGNFLKTHWVDCLLFALGPIGWIIEALRLIPKVLGQIKGKSGGIKLETENPENNPIKSGNGNLRTPSGKIEVINTLNNNTMFPASSSINVMEQNNLKLVPSK